jgi:hypothetical protein
MRGAAAWVSALTALAAPTLALSQTPSAVVAGLIADARAQGLFVDASTATEPQARHVASGVVCRFTAGDLAAIQLLPARAPADNVGCTMRRGTGILALEVQRIPADVDAAKFLVDMVEVVRADFPGAKPVAPPAGASPDLKIAHFNAVFEGRPVYVEVTAIHAGSWMVSAHMVAPLKDAGASDKITRAEVQAAANEALQAAR